LAVSQKLKGKPELSIYQVPAEVIEKKPVDIFGNM
jgi:hypothetical protein